MVSFAEAYAELELEFMGGIHPSATAIKNAFKKMALKYHPDKNKSPDAEEKFKRILKAYEAVVEKKMFTCSEEDDNYFSFRFASYEETERFFEEKFEALLQREKTGEEEEPSSFFGADEEYENDVNPSALQDSRKKVWDDEDAKTDKERRKNYFCGMDYISVHEVEDWPTYFTNHTVKILSPDEPRVVCDDHIARKVGLVSGNVAHFEADAVLNSVNEWLLRGGGVDYYVRSRAGGKIEWELQLARFVETGSAVITRGYNLPAKYVIHCCGPVGPRPKHLALCYKSALDLAAQHNIRTIGMCGISAGNNGYPLSESTRVAMKTIRKWLEQGDNRSKIDKIVFVCYRSYEMREYEKWMQKYFPSSQFLGEAMKEIEPADGADASIPTTTTNSSSWNFNNEQPADTVADIDELLSKMPSVPLHNDPHPDEL